MINKWLKVIAIIESIVFLGLGLYFFFFTQKVSSKMGVAFNSINGLADYKAVYGGLHLGLGAFMLINLLRRNYRMVILTVFTVVFGLAIARSLSMIIDHAVTAIMLVLLGIEIIVITINGILLLSIKAFLNRV